MYYDIESVKHARSVKIASILQIDSPRTKIFIRCPFHNERTASFVLYADNSYHCYGCGKHGNNAIDFLRELGCTFGEALEELAKY